MQQRKLTGNETKRIVFRCDGGFHAKLSDFAHSQGKSMSMILEEAVEFYIEDTNCSENEQSISQSDKNNLWGRVVVGGRGNCSETEQQCVENEQLLFS